MTPAAGGYPRISGSDLIHQAIHQEHRLDERISGFDDVGQVCQLRLSAFQKLSQSKPKKEAEKGGKDEKSKRVGAQSQWISYKDIMLSASEQGEAEILFDAIDEITRKIEQLGKVRGAVENLEKSAGKDIVYIVYVHNGTPEKIVLRHKRDNEFAEKFKFGADFSVLKEEVYP